MPTLDLPDRFKREPYNSDYYAILGLSHDHYPSQEKINDAARKQCLIFHPDKIGVSHLPLEEAKKCTQAILEIRSIFLSQCESIMEQGKENEATAAVSKDVKFTNDLSPGEQLKAYLLAYSRSERFCEYPKGTGPRVPGYWSYVQQGKHDTEVGRSYFSKNLALANAKYQIELNSNDCHQPVTVFKKNTVPFTIVTDPDEIDSTLKIIEGTIPKTTRDWCAKVYGDSVREPLKNTVEMFNAAQPYIIRDAQGDNYADKIEKNPDDSFTISGRNTHGQPRQLTLHQDKRIVGYKQNASLGIVEQQFCDHKLEIFKHFNLTLYECIPALAPPALPAPHVRRPR